MASSTALPRWAAPPPRPPPRSHCLASKTPMGNSLTSTSATKASSTSRQPPMTADLLLGVLRHDRAVVLASLSFVVLFAWAYLLTGAGVGMETMDMGGGQMMAM